MSYVLAIAALFVLPYAAWRFFHTKKKRPASAPSWVRYGRIDY
jgi:ABC-type antimicrobial peptide transport system permease subunit